MRISKSYTITNVLDFKFKLLSWAQCFEHAACYDSNQYSNINNSKHLHHTYEIVAGVGSVNLISPSKSRFSSLKKIINEKQDWVFGYLGYDLKNEVEKLESNNFDGILFGDMEFFIPRYVFLVTNNNLEILYHKETDNPDKILEQINNIDLPVNNNVAELKLIPRIKKDAYINTINKLLTHIHRGDIYEINFCQEFYNDNVSISPVTVYKKLTEISPTPFSCFYKSGDKYLICASPERFLKKEKEKIISQPIKGTIRRGKTDEEDKKLIKRLKTDKKELAENTMIVDLVRNDLSRTAKRGTVKVDEYTRIYSFRLLHQMISTISAELDDNFHIIDVIKNLFPMGSMTGAPKIRAMELIEEYEQTKRGLFSGAVGYFTPQQDFDFNVVIRSILYNSTLKYISCSFGSAITSKAIAENEYEECLLKAKAIFKIFNNS